MWMTREKSLKAFTRAFGDDFRVLTAVNAADGFKLLERHADEIGLLLTDQRMPGEKGVWLLERARHFRPRIVRILVTAYTDTDAMITAVNSGAISKFITKPWDPPQLEIILRQSLEFFMVQAERDQLLLEKMSVLRNMMIADRIVSLGLLAAGLSHQIRNSLVAVKTFLDLARPRWPMKGRARTACAIPIFGKTTTRTSSRRLARSTICSPTCVPSADSNTATQFADEVSPDRGRGGGAGAVPGQTGRAQNRSRKQDSGSLPALRADKAKFFRLFELLLKDELAMLPAGSRISFTAELQDAGGRPEIVLQISDQRAGSAAGGVVRDL